MNWSQLIYARKWVKVDTLDSLVLDTSTDRDWSELAGLDESIPSASKSTSRTCYLALRDWLLLAKSRPLRNLTIKLVCLPLLFHPFNLRCWLHTYPQYWRGPPGQKPLWFQAQKSSEHLYWAVYKRRITTPWSSIKRERAHAAHSGADVREYTCRLQLPHWWQSKREVS